MKPPVGSLPWLCNPDEEVCNFGGYPNSDQLLKLFLRIKTFSESMDDKAEEIKEIQFHIKNASRLVFLGFAYHEQNMRLLFPSDKNYEFEKNGVKIYGTTKGMSHYDEKHVLNFFKNILKIPYEQIQFDSYAVMNFINIIDWG